MEIKGSPSRPVEVAVIIARGSAIIATLHMIINPVPSTSRRVAITHTRGIPEIPTGNKISTPEARSRFRAFLIQHDVRAMVTTQATLTSMKPPIAISIIRFEPLEWSQRGFHYAHQVNYLHKQGQVKHLIHAACSAHIHRAFDLASRGRTLTMKQRHRHGYQCALSDALEMYLYWRSPLETRSVPQDTNPIELLSLFPSTEVSPQNTSTAKVTYIGFPQVPRIRIRLPRYPGDVPCIIKSGSNEVANPATMSSSSGLPRSEEFPRLTSLLRVSKFSVDYLLNHK